MNDLYYSRLRLPVGVRLEMVTGGEGMSPRVAEALARQVIFEKGPAGYRTFSHFSGGAPCDDDSPQRISVSHTEGMYVVAELPRTPDVNLEEFSVRTAMGVDVEKADRAQAVKVRDRFLSMEEQAIVASDSVEANVLAWTLKEAMLKAGMDKQADIRKALKIKRLPAIDAEEGEGELVRNDGKVIPMRLWATRREGYIISVAFSTKCALFYKPDSQ